MVTSDNVDDTPPLPDLSLRSYANKDNSNNNSSLVKVLVPDDPHVRHVGARVVCVIDLSYSMEMEGPLLPGQEAEEKTDLNTLDIVKHATKTIIQTMGPSDRLAVVAYHTVSEVVQDFLFMTDANKSATCTRVESMVTAGSTNIWGGMYEALELSLKEQQQEEEGSSTETHIFLFTDGQPTIHPPAGELPTLEKYLADHSDLRVRVSTFGFGYNLDSKLLHQMAVKGGGFFGFIPDTSFVGTVFINAAANVLSAIPLTRLRLVLGDKQTNNNGFLLPSLIYGQTFDWWMRDDNNKRSSESITLVGMNDKTLLTTAPEQGDDDSNEHLVVADVRDRIVAFIYRAEGRFSKKSFTEKSNHEVAMGQAQKDHAVLVSAVEDLVAQCSNNTNLEALLADLQGQIAQAYQRLDWHTRWGQHYLLSLARAHELQICSNFKDPGVQSYGDCSEKFTLIRDVAEDVFQTLPPPTPTGTRDSIDAAPVSMSSYYNSSAPCFAAGDVTKSDGTRLSIRRVTKGDVLLTSTGEAVRVRCVVVTACAHGQQPMVDLGGGVLVTPWHPVRSAGVGTTTDWEFPMNLATAGSSLVTTTTTYDCDEVYSLVLEEGAPGGSFKIGNEWEAVSLGHGLDPHHPVLQHDYLATSRVIEDLSQMEGWDEGRVCLGPNPGVRDVETGRIVRYQQERVVPQNVVASTTSNSAHEDQELSLTPWSCQSQQQAFMVS